MLEIKNIEVIYNEVLLVVRGVSLEVPENRIVCLLGANGAGKTTVLKAISGLLSTELGEITHGSIEFDGQLISRMTPEEVAGCKVIQVMENRRLYEHLNTEENLLVGAYTITEKSVMKRQLEMVYNYFPGLKRLRDRTAGYLSGGEQQMLVIGQGLMALPKILCIDEASLGLAPLMVASLMSVIQRICTEQHIAILLVEQNAIAALDISSYGYVMENGRVVLDGPSDELKENEDIKEFYLGLSEIGRKSYKDVKHYRRRKRWLG
jgi:branched-chain amino acid transport system ATP-binding protein